MSQPLVPTAPIPDPLYAQVEAEVATLETELASYLVSLTGKEIQETDKIGDRMKEFVARALNFIADHPGAFPPDMNAAQKLQAFLLYTQTNALADRLEALAMGLRNASYIAGADAKAGALLGYGLMEMMGRNNPIMKAEYTELKKFFPRTSESNPAPKP